VRFWGAIVSVLLASTASAQEFGARARVRAEATLGSTSVTRDQANERPASLGEPARALLDAPGAARTSFAGGALIVWGASADETRSYVDGIEIPSLFHPTGLRTTVHPALIEQVSLTPGALPAEYGRGLGGAVEVETVKLQPGVRAEARVDAIDSSLSAVGGNARVRALVGLRYGYFDRVLARLAPASQGLLAVPSHADGVARVELSGAHGTRLSATWIGARDQVTVRPDSGRQTRYAEFQLGTVRMERRYDDGARLRIAPFLSWSSAREHSVFEQVPLALARRGYAYGMRADFQQHVPALGGLGFRIGLDVRGTRDDIAREGTLSLPAREGDIRVFAQAPVDQVSRDDYRVLSLNVAPWAALSLRWRDFTLTPGLRLEGYLLSVSRVLPRLPGMPALGHDAITIFPEPRLALGHRTTPWLRFEARTGLVHQLPDARDLSASFGNPRLTPARGLHAALASSVSLPCAITAELTGFYKSMHALAVRTELSPALLAQQLVPAGRGTVLGASVTLRRELREPFFALSYTLSRSLRSDPDGRLRRFDFDQPHVFSGVVGFARGGFLASARLRAASGMPRTRVIGSYIDGKTGLAQPLFGEHNRSRLPTYVALDLHVEYRIPLAHTRLAIFADVLNVSNRTNVEDFAYAANYTRRRDPTSIPIVAMAGVSLKVDDAQ
jgi:TonB dependent receptor/TonB-dependent Receptor Plug Domain